MATNNAAQRQGAVVPTLPREKVVEGLAELEERINRFVEVPDILRALDRVFGINGEASCSDSIREVIDNFIQFDMPMFLQIMGDGIQHRLDRCHDARERVYKDLGITREDIWAYQREMEKER